MSNLIPSFLEAAVRPLPEAELHRPVEAALAAALGCPLVVAADRPVVEAADRPLLEGALDRPLLEGAVAPEQQSSGAHQEYALRHTWPGEIENRKCLHMI